MTRIASWSLFTLLIFCAAASGQTVQAPFNTDYSVIDLGTPPGVPASLGGITFLDSDTLLIGGAANGGSGAIYQIDIARDAMSNTITGFVGTASVYATAPNIDGGLAFGPGGVLFYTGYNNNILGQIKPGSSAPDKVINLNTLSPPIASSVGTLQFVPTGFAGAGQLKVASYNGNTWYTVSLAPDGLGTYDISAVSPSVSVTGGPEGIVYIDAANPGFVVDSILLSEYNAGAIGAYEIDANGDPIFSSRRPFITGLSGAEGAEIDALTGDFLFSTFGGGNRVIVVTGFIPTIPEPAACVLAFSGALVLWASRRRN
jgi:hypothetical protein